MLVKLFINPDLELRKKTIDNLIKRVCCFAIKESNLTLDHPDLLYFSDEEKLGVEQTKKIKEHLSLKPYSAKDRVVALISAHDLTTQAQNSLLKILEEPPLNSKIFLGASSENALLSTILSRCELIFLNDSGGVELPRMTMEIDRLFTMTIAQRFQFIESVTEKNQFLEELLVFFREKMKKDVSLVMFTKKLLQAEEWAKASVNIRGILEYLMLNFPSK